MQTEESLPTGSSVYSSTSSALGVYLLVFTCWWIIAMFVLTVRIPVQAWSPVVVFFWTHALLVEKVFPTSFWLARGFWLVVMLSSGAACCYLVEFSRKRNPKHLWRRAILSSVAVQLLAFVMGIVLAPE